MQKGKFTAQGSLGANEDIHSRVGRSWKRRADREGGAGEARGKKGSCQLWENVVGTLSE